ncbi:hypothetical protein ABZ725_14065 [Streptomyces sp. NPDC006872]|uniref:hypothetical protein n=1 Tax=Streptomyces sp. NPDC006872 TaxID=3155720 RepID=UPI00340EA571
MTFAELTPVRLAMFARHGRTRHRAVDEVDRLKFLLFGANLCIGGMHIQLDDQKRRHAETIARIDERYTEIIAGLEEKAADLERRLNIACQATAAADQTQEIDTATVARICAKPVPLHQAPMAATTDPGRVPPSWALKEQPQLASSEADIPNPPYDLPEGDWR